jgi:hypothetical protein
MSHALRTAGALLATSALAFTTLGQPAVAAAPAAATDDGAITIAGSWLKGELTDGLVVGEFGPDYGLSIDAGLGLDQAGDRTAVRAISNALAPKVESYISGGAADPSSTYAGPTAKAATFASVAGANPASYGGVNLIGRLEERVSGTAPIVGRIQDKSTFGDFANVIGQSYAVRALSKAKSQEADEALSFLLAQQCSAGFFRLNFPKSTALPTQGCDADPTSAADMDATSLAVINLVGSRANAKPVQDALAKAGTWLASKQKANGSFGGGASTTKSNTNSTGLAGYALGLLKNRDAATKAAVYVRKLQPVDKNRCRSALTRDTGAIGYDKAAVKTARTAGITPATTDQWRRATAQAMAVLQWAPASSDALSVSSRRGRAEAGDRVRFQVFGISPGERACIGTKGDAKRIVGKATGGRIARKLVMPTGTKTRTVKVRTADDAARTRIKVTN